MWNFEASNKTGKASDLREQPSFTTDSFFCLMSFLRMALFLFLSQVDIDECSSNPCLNGATCTQYVASYTCTCPLGFSGINCATNDQDCTDSSCMNGGTCVDGINTYTCICPEG